MNVLEIQTLACGAYGWFLQALIRLCVCAAVAFIAVLLREAAYFTCLAVLTLLSVCILFGGEKIRSGNGPLGERALPFSVTIFGYHFWLAGGGGLW